MISGREGCISGPLWSFRTWLHFRGGQYILRYRAMKVTEYTKSTLNYPYVEAELTKSDGLRGATPSSPTLEGLK